MGRTVVRSMSHISACIDELMRWVFISDDLIFEEEGEEESLGYYPALCTTPNSPFPPAPVMNSACVPFEDEEEDAKRPRPPSVLLTCPLAPLLSPRCILHPPSHQ